MRQMVKRVVLKESILISVSYVQIEGKVLKTAKTSTLDGLVDYRLTGE